MEDDEPHRIRLLSWNIDGLDQGSLLARTKAVCETIKKERPHIIYLQEVVSETLSILQEKCSPAYRCIVGRHSSGEPTVGEYFVAMLLRNESVEYVSHNVLPFYTSQMGRCLLKVEATVKGVPCLLMTSHLESTGSHTAERKRQLKAAFDVMTKCDAQHTVIFGGDMNLRDKEVQQIGGLPRGVDDIWEATGRRQEAAYTWDTQRNDNLEWAHRFGPRCRFDRLFYRPNDRLTAVYFELVGLERLSSCRRFPSDHWGILAHFNKK
jgi:tyrosyl-DNA phosphodiesterase 2